MATPEDWKAFLEFLGSISARLTAVHFPAPPPRKERGRLFSLLPSPCLPCQRFIRLPPARLHGVREPAGRHENRFAHPFGRPSTTSAINPPMIGANLNPWPLSPAATTRPGRSGSWSIQKSPSNVSQIEAQAAVDDRRIRERRKVAAQERAHSRFLRRQHGRAASASTRRPGRDGRSSSRRWSAQGSHTSRVRAMSAAQTGNFGARQRSSGPTPDMNDRLRRGPHHVGEMRQERRRPRARGQDRRVRAMVVAGCRLCAAHPPAALDEARAGASSTIRRAQAARLVQQAFDDPAALRPTGRGLK